MAPVLLGSRRSINTLHSRSVKYFFISWLGMLLSPGLQYPRKTNSRSTSPHHCLIAAYFAPSCSSRKEILSLVSSERRLSFWYLMKARQRCSKSCGTRQRTKLVKLQEPYRLFSNSQNSLPLRSQISYRSQSQTQISCRFNSLMRYSSARISARITVLFLALDSGHSSKVKRETSILLRFTECSRSALVILVELAPTAAALLPLGVMNLSSLSSSQ